MYKYVLALACAAVLAAPLSAQAGEVHDRQIRQEHRIDAGVDSGTLSPREAARLQSQEGRLAARRSKDLHDGDGLSGRQFRQLNRQQNRLSREIYREKHDGPRH